MYKPKPDREIVHAHKFVVDPALVAGRDLNEEHIVSKTQRFVEQLVLLDEGLLGLAHAVGVKTESDTLFGISRKELDANGWMSYRTRQAHRSTWRLRPQGQTSPKDARCATSATRQESVDRAG